MPPKYSVKYIKGFGYLVKNHWYHRSKIYVYYGNAERAMKLSWI